MSETNLKYNLVMGFVNNITRPLRAVTSGTNQFDEKIKATQGSLKTLSANTKDIEHFRKLKRSVSQSTTELNEARANVARLSAEMRNTDAPTQKMSRAFEKAKNEVNRLVTAQQKEQIELQQTRERLRSAGVETTRLNEATRRIRQQTQQYNQDLERQQQQLAQTAARERQLAQIRDRNRDIKSSAMGDVVGVGAAIFGAKKLVDAYGEVSSAQGEIKSLGIDDSGIKAITKSARAFSSEWAGTTTSDFIKASYDIKSGISSLSNEAVGEFTKMAALTATGTKSTVGTMTNLFATGYSIYRKQFNGFGAQVVKDWGSLSQAEKDLAFGKYFSSGVAASVQQFKTDGDKITQFMKGLGASATNAKQSFAEQLAVGGMLSASFEGGQAATKYQQFLANAGKASEALGIQVHDANGDLLSTGSILQEISDKYGGTINDIDKQELTKAFGTKEAVDLIDMMLPKLDELKTKTSVMQDELKNGTRDMSLTFEMAEAIGKGPAESFQIFGQQVFNLATTVGAILAPAMLFVTSILGGFTTGLDSVIQEFPLLSGAIGFVIAGLIGLKVASIASRLTFVLYSDTVLTLTKAKAFFTLANLRAKAALIGTRLATMATSLSMVAMTVVSNTLRLKTYLTTMAMNAFSVANLRAKAGLMGTRLAMLSNIAVMTSMAIANKAMTAGTYLMAGAMRVFNFVMASNPIGLVITAVMALAAWGLSLVDDWRPVTQFFSDLWSGLTSAFSLGWAMLKEGLKWTPLGMIVQAWEPITGFFSDLWSGVKTMSVNFFNWITEAIIGPLSSVKNMFSGIWSMFDGDGPRAEVVNTIRQTSDAIPALASAKVEQQEELSLRGHSSSMPTPSPVTTGVKVQSSTGYVDNSRTEIVINASEGMDVRAIGEEVQRRIDEHNRNQARRVRGTYVDA